MDFCSTHYMTMEDIILFIMFFCVTAIFFISVVGINIRKKKQKKIFPFVISASISAAVIVLPIAVMVVDLVVPPQLPPDITAMVDLKGYDYNDCRDIYAEYFDLTIESEEYSSEYPKGTIIRHSPREGMPIEVGNAEVRCVVSKGVETAE